MSFLVLIYNRIFYQPLFNTLVALYNLVPGKNFGLAVILLTLLVKLLLYPLNRKSIESQKTISDLEPKIKEIREKFKDDQEKAVKETFDLYKEVKVNPFSNLILLFIQLPVLFAVFRVFNKGVSGEDLGLLYSFIPSPGEINPYFFSVNLGSPNFFMALIASVLQFFQTKIQSGKMEKKGKGSKDFSQVLQKQMIYFLPILSLLILAKLPSAIPLYLAVSALFSLVQTSIIYKNKNSDEEEKKKDVSKRRNKKDK